MCVEPTRLADGTLAGCRYCWRCVSNHRNDWSGRCIAESEYSSQTLAVTLTYAGGYDNPSAVALVYDDYQRFMKRMRKKLTNVRYLVAGEYGTKKERSHWHSILFLKDKPLNIVDDPFKKEPWDIFLERPQYQGKPGGDPLARIQWGPWSNHDMNGFAYFQQPDYSGITYVLKYIQKDQKQQGSERNFAMSKKPPLGHEYFNDRAKDYAEQGLAPQNWYYSFPHILDKKLRPRQFFMTDTTRANFVEAYKLHWQNLHGDMPHPYSPVIEEFEDKAIAEEMENAITDEQYLEAKKQWPKYQDPDFSPDLMNNNPLEQYFVRGKINGRNYFGIESNDQVTKQRYLTVYTEDGQTWHGEGIKLRNVQLKGFVTINHAKWYEEHREEFNERIANWKEAHGLFPPQLQLPH